jgi:hypothetical protein
MAPGAELLAPVVKNIDARMFQRGQGREQASQSGDVTRANTSGFTARSSPQGSQVSDECGTFTVNQSGPVIVSGKEKCWNR